MTCRLKFSAAAREDILDIWSYTASAFGAEQADTYHTLLEQAFADIAEEPQRASSRPRPELGDGFRSYRVALSSKRSGTHIRNAPHVIIYVFLDASTCGVSRVLHESMETKTHIPDSHKTGDDAFFEAE